MKNFAFISSDEPTAEQHAVAANKQIKLIYLFESDPFNIDHFWVQKKGNFDGVVVTHPAVALNLRQSFLIGIFNNINVSQEGETPNFQPLELGIFDNREYTNFDYLRQG